MLDKARTLLTKIRQNKPLILNLTNFVTMDFVANGLLSLGASPVMSLAEEEMADLLAITKAMVVNPGTLNDSFIKLSKTACKIANEVKVPIILDPVGAGASRYRTQTSMQLINDFSIAIIRGNASEIMSLAGAAGITKGVDSTADAAQALASGHELADQYNTTVVISGQIDVIISTKQTIQCNRGSAMMPLVTGTGCLLSAVVGAFHAVEADAFTAAAAATLFYGICGEMAEKKADYPGSYRSTFIDALSAVEL